MAAFASSRRSGWVRLLVVILCALFIFATIATPPAYAVGETAALFTAAAVLSAAVAALGFKLSNDSDGIATLNKMVTDFTKEVWALNLLVVGNRINGLIDGMNYIKMAVHNGKTYLDERVVAWCQQWLGNNGVYDSGVFIPFDYSSSSISELSFQSSISLSDLISISPSEYQSYFLSVQAHYNILNDSNRCFDLFCQNYGDYIQYTIGYFSPGSILRSIKYMNSVPYVSDTLTSYYYVRVYSSYSSFGAGSNLRDSLFLSPLLNYGITLWALSNYGSFSSTSSNSTGISGTDTIGADYKDKTLDQILDGLKNWAQDWYDAGADSATNTATGAIDLPVTVGDQAATANPALNPDVVYNPPFSIPWPGVRSGETSSGAISDGKANADAAETATTDVAENQSVIDSLVNWALNYINPDTGLFSKFPLCVPYDAYLLVTSSLGVNAVSSDSIFGASPGDLDGVVSQGIETYSDFQPIINIKHDFELDGATYPLELTIDLTPWQPLVTFFREGMALLLVAELIGAEFKRIRGH